MQPVPRKFLSRHSLALRDLRFVMREDVVDPAAMHIDLVTQQCCGHGAALDVPSGTTSSPGRIAFYMAVFFVPCFPQCEVTDVFLIVFVMLHAAR